MNKFALAGACLVLSAVSARAQYVDGLPPAASVSSSDLMPVIQGSKPVVGAGFLPGSGVARRATVGQIAGGLSTSLVPYTGAQAPVNLGSQPVTTTGAITGSIAASSITSGTLPAARIPMPSASTLGGVQSAAGATHQWISGISTSGVPVLSQPSAADVSGLGSLATQNSNAAAITGGTISGANVSGAVSTATGGSTARTAAAHFSDVVNVANFGAVFDGQSHPLSEVYSTLAAAQAVYPFATALTNERDGVAIQAAINYCQSRVVNYAGGCAVVLPNGTGLVNLPISETQSNISVVSQGAGFLLRSVSHVTYSSFPTRLLWTGMPVAAGTPENVMLTISPLLADGRDLAGASVKGVLFDCNGVAGCAGLLINSVRDADIEVAAKEPAPVIYTAAAATSAGSQIVQVASTAGLVVGAPVEAANVVTGTYVASVTDATHFNMSSQAATGGIASGASLAVGGAGLRIDVLGGLGDSNSTQRLHIRYSGMQVAAAANLSPPLMMVGGSGTAAAGGAYGNFSLNVVDSIYCTYNNGDCLDINNSDHNVFRQIAGQNIGGGSGQMVVSNGSLDANNGAARYNRFDEVGNVAFIGTDAGGFTAPSIFNQITWLQAGNGASPPTTGTGASVCYASDNFPSSICLGSAWNVGGVLSGRGGTASGASSVVIGGNGSTASATASAVTGISAVANNYGAFCSGSGAVVPGSPGQWCSQPLRGTASGTSAVRLTADGGAASTATKNTVCLLAGSQANGLDIMLSAIDHTAPANSFSWDEPHGFLVRPSTAASTVYAGSGTATTIANGATTGATVSVSADTTLGCLNVSFTPPTGNSDQWDVVANVRWSETH